MRRDLKHLLCFVATPLASMLFSNAAHAEHYKIWIKAFIPNDGLDILMPLPGDTSKSIIPGPHLLGIPVDTACYNTNDRSFSDNPGDDAKITEIIEFDVTSVGLANVTKSAPTIGQTIRYNCDDGSIIATAQAKPDNVTIGNLSYNAGVVSFSLDGEASNPLVPAPNALTPSIKFHGMVKLDTNSRSVGFTGTIARFPSYEAYIQVDGGKAKAIFQIAPNHDATAWSLLFNNSISPTVPY